MHVSSLPKPWLHVSTQFLKSPVPDRETRIGPCNALLPVTHRRRIFIQCQQPARRPQLRQNPSAVASPAVRPVDVATVAPDRQTFQHLLQQHWFVV